MTEIVGGPPRDSAEKPVRALVIDDDPSIVRFLEIYLEGHGFKILAAHSGGEGIEELVIDGRVISNGEMGDR